MIKKQEYFMADLKHVGDADFAAATASGVVLVDFYADWCGPCRMVAPVLEKMAPKLHGKASIVKINTDEATQTAGRLRITSIPTLILYKNGHEVGRVVGVKGESDLMKWVEGHL